VTLLVGVVLGGSGSLAGAAWGAAALVLVPTWADDASKALSLSSNVEANLALAIYGVVLIALMLVAPGGIQAAVRRLGAFALRAAQPHARGSTPWAHREEKPS
jgi:branched-chain amino acid transport system permease protein